MICSPRWLLLAIWTPLKTKLSTGGCLTTSEFVCTTEQRDRSREKLEKAIDLAYTTCNCAVRHAHLIMWLAHCLLAADCEDCLLNLVFSETALSNQRFHDPSDGDFGDLHYGATTLLAEVKKDSTRHLLEERARQYPKTVSAKTS